MKSAYQRRLAALALVLYECDPFGMGASIHAPDDEYRPAAGRLLPLLSRVTSVEGRAGVLAEHGIHGAEVARRVWAVFADA
ncbi:hypothetical protein [Micromonospora sp. DT233]|uniref:hypothetical protein n=1 Tax=Micromonospora sp. DT233 TaxID=3393432 RepID=UPI003CF0EA70